MARVAWPGARRRRRRRGHGQAWRPGNDRRFRSRPDRDLRFRCRRDPIRWRQAAAADAVFHTLTQRLISAFTAPDRRGPALRGRHAPAAVRPEGARCRPVLELVHYQASEAWTWEHLALTRARVLAGAPRLKVVVEAAIANILKRRRDRAKVAEDVRSMRARIEREKGSKDVWDLKQVRGGQVDLEFIAQYLQLVHAAEPARSLEPKYAHRARQPGAGRVPSRRRPPTRSSPRPASTII